MAEAVRQFQAELPTAVLLDIDLPDGSGLDVLRDIKREHPDAIVIMITGNVQIDNTISALRGGAYDFIAKPINLEEFRVELVRLFALLSLTACNRLCRVLPDSHCIRKLT